MASLCLTSQADERNKLIALLATLALSSTPCTEDQSCWNWRTMGNHHRGVTLTSGRREVVGPVRFDRLKARHLIDWAKSGHLKGDN